jgi:hypothetical protein
MDYAGSVRGGRGIGILSIDGDGDENFIGLPRKDQSRCDSQSGAVTVTGESSMGLVLLIRDKTKLYPDF